MQEIMLKAAKAAMKNAYSPYSNFKVGVALLAEDNQIFAGCNVENASYGLTQCAESSAIGAMVVAGKKKIKEIVIISSGDKIISPCGACRQRLIEFAEFDAVVHMYGSHEKRTMTFGELLPLSFSEENLEV